MELKSTDVLYKYEVEKRLDDNRELYNVLKIGQGDGLSQRKDKQIRVKKIFVRYTIRAGVSMLEDQPARVRVMLVQDKQVNAGKVTIEELLESNNGESFDQSFRNIRKSERFRYLYDKTHTMGFKNVRNDVIDSGEVFKDVNFITTYQGNGDTVGAIATNAVYLIVTSDFDKDEDYDEYIRFSAVSRVRYEDYKEPLQSK